LIPLQPATGERKERKIEKPSGKIYYQINFGRAEKVVTFAVPKQTGKKREVIHERIKGAQSDFGFTKTERFIGAMLRDYIANLGQEGGKVL